MLSYRHAFHAGNFADVFKHVALTALLHTIMRKEKPFFYLDTHAGAGMYDLCSKAPQETAEYADGIGYLWDRSDAPGEVADYLSVVRHFNPDGRPRYYPGSPAIARQLIRPCDRMALCELHNSDFPSLAGLFAGDRRVQVHHKDGYKGLTAFLPPKERRGLVLVDPSYEVKQEYAQVVREITAAHQRWPSGTYAIWYPILKSRGIEPFGNGFQQSGMRKILRAEMVVAKNSPGMQGTGMIIINPPWQFKESLESLLPWLLSALAADEGQSRVDWLVEE
jgi:23S rRNA (adenine2030-N6)-methyltransferase